MPTNVITTPYNAKISGSYGFYYPVKGTDWGLVAPGTLNATNNNAGTSDEGTWANANLAYNAGGGSLAMGTAFIKISYVSASGGISVPSAEVSVSIAAGTGAVTITLPNPTPGAVGQTEAGNILGWAIWSSGTTGTEQLNTTGITSGLLTLTATNAYGQTTTVPYIPLSQTTAQVQVYGTGATAGTNNNGYFIQQPLPKIAANTSADTFVVVDRRFRAVRDVLFTRPYSATDPSALVITSADCIAPVWPASTAITSANGTSTASSSYIVLNGVLFACTTAGTTASSIPTFNFTPGATTTDNTATWTCLGYRGLLRLRWSNTSATAGQPQSQEYDFLQT